MPSSRNRPLDRPFRAVKATDLVRTFSGCSSLLVYLKEVPTAKHAIIVTNL